MSYRKKHYPPKPERMEQQALYPEVQYRNPGVSRDLSTASLTSGLPYQRPVAPKDVDRLIREWEDSLLTPLIISFRDGNFNVVDGQHRIAAMRKMAGDKDVTVPCLIYNGLSYEQEAGLYYKLEKAKGHLRLSHSIKAQVESGSNAELTEIKRLLEEAGFIWALDRPTGKPFEISCSRAVVHAYRLLGSAAFARMLGLLAGTWHGMPGSLKAPMFSGLSLFLKTYETELNDRLFIKRLSTIGPDEIIRRSNADFTTNRAALRYARVICDQYNGKQHGGRKLPYRFHD